jgi:hypothetical protein
MATVATNPKQEAHELIDRMSVGQVIAAVGLFKAMLDPVEIALANAPLDDEPLTVEEIKALDESRGWLEHNEGIPTNRCWLNSASPGKRSTTTRNRSEADHLARPRPMFAVSINPLPCVFCTPCIASLIERGRRQGASRARRTSASHRRLPAFLRQDR